MAKFGKFCLKEFVVFLESIRFGVDPRVIPPAEEPRGRGPPEFELIIGLYKEEIPVLFEAAVVVGLCSFVELTAALPTTISPNCVDW